MTILSHRPAGSASRPYNPAMGRVSERADARANRERLVTVAREVFAERGIGADVKEICERSGIGIATFYRNFPTKDDLVSAIIAEVMAEVLELLESADAHPDAREALDAVITGALLFVERHQELARVLREDARKKEQHLAQMAALTGRLERMVDRARSAGVVRADIDARFLTEYLAASNVLYLELLETWPPDSARDWLRTLTWSALAPS